LTLIGTTPIAVRWMPVEPSSPMKMRDGRRPRTRTRDFSSLCTRVTIRVMRRPVVMSVTLKAAPEKSANVPRALK